MKQILLIAMLCVSQVAIACMCLTDPLATRIKKASCVFKGRLIDVKLDSLIHRANTSQPLKLYDFEVLGVHKGKNYLSNRVITVFDKQESSCEGAFQNFEAGDICIIMAYPVEEHTLDLFSRFLISSLCCGNTKISDLSESESNYVDSITWDVSYMREREYVYNTVARNTQPKPQLKYQIGLVLSLLLNVLLIFSLRRNR